MRRTWRQFVGSIGSLLRRMPRCLLVPVGGGDDNDCLNWRRCVTLLDSVLLPTGEHGYLKCRLRNARRYYLQEEWGAAAYELTLALRRARILRRLHS